MYTKGVRESLPIVKERAFYYRCDKCKANGWQDRIGKKESQREKLQETLRERETDGKS